MWKSADQGFLCYSMHISQVFSEEAISKVKSANLKLNNENVRCGGIFVKYPLAELTTSSFYRDREITVDW